MGWLEVLTDAPLYVSWNYTYKCNFNCVHCYSRARSNPSELDTASYRVIADRLADAGVLRVGLGYGEPLVRKDCIEILSRMGERFIDTNITTNAWFLDDETVQRLVDARLGTLFVSLDAATAAEHDAFRRQQGSFERVISGMRAAANAGLKVMLSTVVTSQNFNDLPQIVSLAEDCGIAGIAFKRFMPMGNGVANADTLSLQGGQRAEVAPAIAELNAGSPLHIALFYNDEPDDGVDHGCVCGTTQLYVRPNGDIMPCAFSKQPIGNILEDDIAAVWRESPVLAQLRSPGKACIAPEFTTAPLGEGYARPPRRRNGTSAAQPAT